MRIVEIDAAAGVRRHMFLALQQRGITFVLLPVPMVATKEYWEAMARAAAECESAIVQAHKPGWDGRWPWFMRLGFLGRRALAPCSYRRILPEGIERVEVGISDRDAMRLLLPAMGLLIYPLLALAMAGAVLRGLTGTWYELRTGREVEAGEFITAKPGTAQALLEEEEIDGRLMPELAALEERYEKRTVALLFECEAIGAIYPRLCQAGFELVAGRSFTALGRSDG